MQVTEPNSAKTYYNYDLLDDLTCVAQDGGNGGGPSSTCQNSAVWRQRSFAYDNLAHLLSAANPETGTTSYAYDYNGNVSTKQDARPITVSYGYDTINRVWSKSYSDGATPISFYQYDTATNGVGQLANAWTQPTGSTINTSFAAGTFLSLNKMLQYDAMGRLQSASQQHCIGTTCSAPSPYSLTMVYDLLGNLNSLGNSAGANGSLLTLTNFFDTASRPCLSTSSWTLPNISNQPTGPANLFQTSSSSTTNNFGYAATGALQNWYLGSTSSTASSGCSNNPSSSIPGNLQQVFSPRLWVTNYAATGQVP
jgi:YD repeat-containing protein